MQEAPARGGDGGRGHQLGLQVGGDTSSQTLLGEQLGRQGRGGGHACGDSLLGQQLGGEGRGGGEGALCKEGLVGGDSKACNTTQTQKLLERRKSEIRVHDKSSTTICR